MQVGGSLVLAPSADQVESGQQQNGSEAARPFKRHENKRPNLQTNPPHRNRRGQPGGEGREAGRSGCETLSSSSPCAPTRRPTAASLMDRLAVGV